MQPSRPIAFPLTAQSMIGGSNADAASSAHSFVCVIPASAVVPAQTQFPGLILPFGEPQALAPHLFAGSLGEIDLQGAIETEGPETGYIETGDIETDAAEPDARVVGSGDTKSSNEQSEVEEAGDEVILFEVSGADVIAFDAVAVDPDLETAVAVSDLADLPDLVGHRTERDVLATDDTNDRLAAADAGYTPPIVERLLAQRLKAVSHLNGPAGRVSRGASRKSAFDKPVPKREAAAVVKRSARAEQPKLLARSQRRSATADIIVLDDVRRERTGRGVSRAA
ncbi:MAG: hypothetical protein NW216_07810 [Hyphomicrobium sp.]|nr:hypothetical protein [Hyphomicrobium sp.]